MRCQAVLEALRGRFDVSRSMLASARESLAELGLRHGLLETDLFAGMVELLAGDPGAAIAPLRAAYEGLGTLGVGADAGQAAALLARALLEQGDVDEADRMATASEQLAGQNLKTAIAWRVARAEVLAARGDATAAVALAGDAVEIAAATDLILDHADACVALARLRERDGDLGGAATNRADALRLYALKGATEPVHRLGATEPAVEPSATQSAPRPEAARRPVSADSRTPYAENLAATKLERGWRLLAAGQLDEFAAMNADDVALIDRRSVVAEDLYGREHIIASVRAFADLGLDAAQPEVLAVRGSKLSLARVTLGFGNTSEIVTLHVLELDEHGLAVRHVFFDEHDLDAAIDELDQRYAAGEGAEHLDLLRPIVAFYRAIRGEQADGGRDLMAPGFEYVDRRPLGFGRGDRDYFVTGMRSFGAVGMTDATEINRTVHVSGRALLVVQSVVRTNEQASEYEWTDATLLALDASDRVHRVEHFALDDWGLALARLDEVGRGETRTPSPRNSAVRQAERLVACFNARDFDGARLLIANDFARFDRRHGVSAPTADGPDAYMDAARAWYDVGFDELILEPLAVRGESLLLSRGGYRATDGREVMFLVVYELDDDGLIARGTHFDEDELASALAELDTRYLAGEGAAHLDVLLAGLAFYEATRRDDFDALREMVAPDYAWVDHELIGFGGGDVEHFIATSRTRRQVASDGVRIIRSVAVEGRALLVVVESTQITEHGNEYTAVSCILLAVDAANRPWCTEYFDETQYAQAQARLRELAAPASASFTIENAATRVAIRYSEVWAPDRLDDLRDFIAPGIVRVDRRSIIGAPATDGRDAFAGSVRALAEVGYTRASYEPLAVRGERLCLGRNTYRNDEGFTTQYLALLEIDAGDRMVYVANFDEADVAAAVAELDARFVAGEGARHGVVMQSLNDAMRALEGGDWDAARAQMTPDCIVQDHRQFGFPLLDRDGFIEILGEYATLDHSYVIAMLRFDEQAALATIVNRAIDTAGGEVEWVFHSVNLVDASGRSRRMEFFAADEFAAASERLHELATPAPTLLTNETVRRLAVYNAAFATRDWARLANLFADDVVNDDRRSTVSSGVTEGRAAMVDLVRGLADVGFTSVEQLPIAVRGEQLALVRRIWHNDDGLDLSLLSTMETDGDSRFTRSVLWNDDNLAAALAELDTRYFTGEGAAYAEMALVAARFGAAVRRDDFDAMRELMTPDFVAVDHRPLGYGRGDREYLINASRTRTQVSADGIPVNRMITCERDGLLLVQEENRITEHGGEYGTISCIVIVVDASQRLSRTEYFPEEEYERALARLHELAAPPPTATPRLDNAATASAQRVSAMAARNDLAEIEAVCEELCAEDIVRLDHRGGVAGMPLQGRAEMVRLFHETFTVFPVFTAQPIAVRGERLALARVQMASPEGFAIRLIGLYDLDSDGRLAFFAHYDESDLPAALAELSRRYIAGEGARHADVLRVCGAFSEANLRADWDGLRDLLAPDFVVVDHRSLGYGEGGREHFIDASRARTQVSADGILVTRTIEIEGRALLATSELGAATPEGNEYTHPVCAVFDVDASNQLARLEWFDDDQYAEALARFHALAAPAIPAVENRVVSTLGQMADLIAAGRVDDASELIAEGMERVDRRRGVSAPPLRGRDAYAENARAFWELFQQPELETVAVRGERHALVRAVATAANGFEVVWLGLYEADTTGAISYQANYDDDDLEAALDELDLRYVAGEGAEHHYLISRIMDRRRAGSDADALRALYPANAVVRNNRRIGWPMTTVDDLIERICSDTGVANSTFVSAWNDCRGDTIISRVEQRLTTVEGNRYTVPFWSVQHWTAGLIDHTEFFELEDFNAARSCFDELSAESRTPQVDNLFIRTFVRGDWLIRFRSPGDRLELLAPDVVEVDHRRGVSAPDIVGIGAYLENQRAVREVFGRGTVEYLAVRGDRLLLARVSYTSPEHFTGAHLALFEADEAGRLCRNDIYDEDDLASALDALDARYVAGVGAEHEYTVRRLAEHRHAFTARDWDAYERLLDPAFTFVDHRRIGLSSGNRDALLTSLRSSADVAPGAAYAERSLLIDGDVTLTRVQDAATDADGDENEPEHFVVRQFVAGLLLRAERFALDAYAVAHARFEDMAREKRTPYADNALIRMMTRNHWVERRNPSGNAVLDTYHPDCVLIDQRRGVNAGELAGRDQVSASIRSGVDVIGALAVRPLAVRGDRLLLVSWAFEQDAGFEVAGISVIEADTAGRVTHVISFDEDDLVVAQDKLEVRHRALCGDEYSDVERFLAGLEGNGLRRRQFIRDRAFLCAVAADDGVQYLVGRLAADGSSERTERFPEVQWSEALARFDELAGPQTA